MATTHRKATTRLALPTTEEERFGSSVESRKNRTANYLQRQGVSPVNRIWRLEIVVPLLAMVANTAAALHSRSGGSTASVTEGNLLGRSRFAASIYPARSAELTGPPTRDLLFAFAVLNANLLLQPDRALGTWFDSGGNRHVVDVVVCSESVNSAIHIGIDHGQQAIFDTENAREISVFAIPELHSVEVRREEN